MRDKNAVDKQRDIASAQAAWNMACDMLRNRPTMQHVVLTGCAASDALIEYADTTTERRPIKHAFDAGIQTQKGVEL